MSRFVLCLLLTSSYLTAQAFTLATTNPGLLGWDDRPLRFQMNTTNCPAGFSIDTLFDNGAGVWNTVSGSSLQIVRGNPATSSVASLLAGTANETPVVACDPNFGTNTGADPNSVPAVGYVSTRGVKVGYGFILLNVQAGAQANIANFDSNRLSIVLAHEIGHVLGLGHSEDPAALMYYNATAKTTLNLSQDDADGIIYLYPRNEPENEILSCGTVLRNSAPPTNGTHGAWSALILLLLPLWLAWTIRQKKRRYIMSIIRGNLLVFGFALLSSSLTAFAQPHSAGSGKREEAIERVEQKHEAANRESKKRFDAQAKRDAELKKAQEQSLKQQEKERKKQAELLKDIEKSRHEEESKKP